MTSTYSTRVGAIRAHRLAQRAIETFVAFMGEVYDDRQVAYYDLLHLRDMAETAKNHIIASVVPELPEPVLDIAHNTLLSVTAAGKVYPAKYPVGKLAEAAAVATMMEADDLGEALDALVKAVMQPRVMDDLDTARIINLQGD